ncbi:hypothetical protein V6K52_05975 [Knoellia sp. S7-12]|uniref:hypothetical protein n=1 Tax=Knoellia sp. S7-12 TaxID=3126698 RepID=UPI003368FF64
MLHLPYAIVGNTPLFAWGAALFLVAVGALCVPTAALGGHVIPGGLLAGLCLVAAAAGCTAVAGSRWAEPAILEGTRRTQQLVYLAPVFALIFFSAGCYLLWQNLRRQLSA